MRLPIGRRVVVDPEKIHNDDKTFSKGNPERRSYPRYQVHKVVSYAHGQKQFLTLTIDLALGGMKIKTHEKLPKNEWLNFKMVLGKNSISLEGRVMYSRNLAGGQRMSGIQFHRLTRRDSALLRAYLSALKE
jgi:hypothetical protein